MSASRRATCHVAFGAILWIAACSGADDGPGGPEPTETADSGTSCVRVSWYRDADGDGYGGGVAELACEAPGSDWIEEPIGDCDDASADVHPAAPETCNGIDDDCDDRIDRDDGDLVGASSGYVDADGDGYGTAPLVEVCDLTGTSPVAGDCDDGNADVNPDASEVCNLFDDDCDGLVDLDDPGVADPLSVFEDVDGDGYGAEPVVVCDATGTAAVGGDCDDGDADVNPIAAEVCNTVDDDCNGLTDTDDADVTDAFWTYEDDDGDGYGDMSILACVTDGTSDLSGDCDDGDADVSPAAIEICNAIDDDCDSAIDDDDDSLATRWIPDGDGDGYGDSTATAVAGCDPPSGYVVADPADCDDADASVYPGAVELCDDVQQDCSDAGWTRDVGVATFYPDGGGYEDWTADLASGLYGATERIVLDTVGELVICDGTWYVDLEVRSDDVTITGLHGSADTILSGGDDTRVLGIVEESAKVKVRGLTMTEGNGCFGAVVSTMIVSSCSSKGGSGTTTTGSTLRLSDVRIENNNPPLLWIAWSMIYSTNGALELVDSTVANNTIVGIEVQGSSLHCTGDPKNDAGIWGNVAGVSMDGYADELLFESEGCDFDGTGGAYTPSYDLQLSSGVSVDWFDFGDDATFSCDASTITCVK